MSYVVRRILLVIPTLLAISLFAFALSNLARGDPAEEYARRVTDAQPTPALVAEIREELGLDRPFVVQYVDWVAHAARGDLGVSYATRRSVAAELADRVPPTLQLTALAGLLALALAVPTGILSAIHRNRFFDHVARVGSLAGASMPSFYLALLLIVLFAVKLGVVPVAGRGDFSSLILPSVTLALGPAAVLARFTRSTMLEVLGDDYVRTARVKGASPGRVVGLHALRNALVPLVTAFGVSLGHLVAGAVIVESIFVWPGVGSLALDAIKQRDLPMIQGFVLYAGAAFAFLNLAVDLAYGAIDPRIARGRPATLGAA